jgi:hypothetical protein
VAEMAVRMALSGENPARELRWAGFLAGTPGAGLAKRAARKKSKTQQLNG